MEDGLRIVEGLSRDRLDDVLEILDAGFGDKIAHELRPSSPEQARRLISGGLVLDRCLAAVSDDGTVVGIAGVAAPGRPFMHLTLRMFREEFGLAGGLSRWLYSLQERFALPRRSRTRRVEVLAVHPSRRGAGVGTALLQAAAEWARAEGADRLVLEVVDTNGRARALYERAGFRHVRTVRTGPLTSGAGYGAVHFMRMDL